MNEPVFPTVIRKCKNNHEILMLIAPWWFDVIGAKCPECGMPFTEMKWHGMCPLTEEPKKDTKKDEDIWGGRRATDNWPAV